MNALRNGALLLCVLMATPALADFYDDDIMALDMPAGFRGPMQEARNAEGVTTTITSYGRQVSGSGSRLSTVAQITVLRPDKDTGPVPAAQRVAKTDRYLEQFLTAVGHQRKSFTRTKIEHIELSGVPVSRVEWQGLGDGLQMQGAMYCALIGSRVVSFHAQTYTGAPPADFAAARAAFEAVKWK